MPPQVFAAFDFRDSGIAQAKRSRRFRLENRKFCPLAIYQRICRPTELMLKRGGNDVAKVGAALYRFNFGPFEQIVGKIECRTHKGTLRLSYFSVKASTATKAYSRVFRPLQNLFTQKPTPMSIFLLNCGSWKCWKEWLSA